MLNLIDHFFCLKLGYVISYLDEAKLKENSNTKWKNEHVNLNPNSAFISSNSAIGAAQNDPIIHTIRKLKLETIYYFRIQVRNNHAYTASSPTIIFRTPNAKGQGGGKIFEEKQVGVVSLKEKGSAGAGLTLISSNGKQGVEMNIIWMIVASVTSLLLLIIVLISVLICRRDKKGSKSCNNNNNNKENYSSLMLRKKQQQFMGSELYDNNHRDDIDDVTNGAGEMFLKQQLLLNSSQSTSINQHSSLINAKPDLLMQMNSRMSCSNSSTASTLIKSQQQQQQQNVVQYIQRTPHHQPMVMMQQLMNPLSINSQGINNNQQIITNNSNTLTDFEFYSQNHQNLLGQNQNLFTNNSTNSNSNNNNQNQYNLGQTSSHLRSVSINEDGMSQSNNDDMLFSANHNFNMEAGAGGGFVRNAIARPKPIAIPIGPNTNSGGQVGMTSSLNSPMDSSLNHFNSSNTRKSFRNLNASQKLHSSSKPYNIHNDHNNQLQSPNDYSNYSPTPSSHSSSIYHQPPPPPPISQPTNQSTKSLLQPLKSFSITNSAQNNTNNNINLNHQIMMNQNSSLSIPNTPAKYCEGRFLFLNLNF
jgi:hypothetical protein